MMMDWNARTPGLWDWDSPGFFGGEAAAAAAVAAASPAKSSISASIGSSPNAGVPAPSTAAGAANPWPARAQEPIGLKLGKRTYFEDAGVASGGGEVKNQPSSSSASSSPAAAAAALAKRSRTPHQALQIFRCQVDGCSADLAGAKEYHRKHKVCDVHSKCPRVVVAGQDLRFCQQCSRFHDLAAFDEKKRSCRKRLANHNARRRKPQQDSISFNSGRFSSPFYDDRRQMNLLFNKHPFGHMRAPASSTWEDSFSISHVKRRPWSKSTKGDEGHLLFPGTDLPNPVSTHRLDLDRLLPFKVTTAEVLNQGLEVSNVASDLDGAPDLRRALSLLSTNSWGSTEPGPTSHAHSVHHDQICTAQHAIHVVNGVSHYLHEELPVVQEVRLQPFAAHNNSSQFQEFQLFKAQYEGNFFDSNQIH